MSWGLNVAGSKKDVIEAVRLADAYGDASQIEAVKEFLAKELEAFPDEPGYRAQPMGIKLVANGHHDPSSRSLLISVERVAIGPPAPKASS